MHLTTPVAIFIFNRPAETARVFAEIARARPTKLFIAADGPRFAGEAARCDEARDIVRRIDWTCDVYTDFSPHNLGCARREVSAFDWVFSQVEEAILLEDDTLPTQSFFRFCSALLTRYRDDSRVMHIGGNNFQFGRRRSPYSYYFSRYAGVWGWATWRRAWREFDFHMRAWPEFRDQGLLEMTCDTADEAAFWRNNFDRAHADPLAVNTYDSQWLFTCWSRGALAIVPEVNLVTNIGFGPEATHTTVQNRNANVPMVDIDDVMHPRHVVRHKEADMFLFRHGYLDPGGGGLAQRCRRRLGALAKRAALALGVSAPGRVP